MHRTLRHVVVSLTLVATAACASSGAQKSSGSPDKLTKAEIEATNTTSAYDVVNRLRPNWLRPAGMTMTGLSNSGSQMVTVYVDNQALGGVETLRSITTASVLSMEFLTPTRAANVVSNIPNGVVTAVILIKTQ
jgi:hypothetical protein